MDVAGLGRAGNDMAMQHKQPLVFLNVGDLNGKRLTVEAGAGHDAGIGHLTATFAVKHRFIERKTYLRAEVGGADFLASNFQQHQLSIGFETVIANERRGTETRQLLAAPMR